MSLGARERTLSPRRIFWNCARKYCSIENGAKAQSLHGLFSLWLKVVPTICNISWYKPSRWAVMWVHSLGWEMLRKHFNYDNDTFFLFFFFSLNIEMGDRTESLFNIMTRKHQWLRKNLEFSLILELKCSIWRIYQFL